MSLKMSLDYDPTPVWKEDEFVDLDDIEDDVE